MSETELAPELAQAETPPVHPWADLAPEHFQLLRLAPLPAERSTGPRPLRFVELGWVERHGDEHSLLTLTLHLPGKAPQRDLNRLETWVDHALKEIRFGPEKGMQTVPANRGLGRFLLARSIAWAKLRWAHYRVRAVELPVAQGLSDENRLRRDHALQAQGFTVSYEDGQTLKAACSAPRVSQLLGDWNGDKVQLLSLLDAGAMLEQASQNLNLQEITIRQLEEKIETYKRDDIGMRFTLACLVVFCVFQAGLLIWMATH